MAFKDAPQCTAKAKSTGRRCRMQAVKGMPVCRLHGGAGGRPIKHGRYSLAHHKSLSTKQAEFLSDERPGDLTDELALMRALLQEHVERYTDDVKLSGDDIGRIMSMVENVSRLVERISRIMNNTALTQAELQFLQIRIADLLNKYVPDEDDRRRFLVELAEPVRVR